MTTIVLQLIIAGILVGGVYGLIAMGFVVVYRSSQVFNMAYGQFATIGAFMAWTFLGTPSAPRFPLPLAMLFTLLFAIAFGLLIERLLFRRLIGRPLFVPFALTLGLLAVLDSIIMMAWGPRTLPYAQTFPHNPIYLGDIVITQEHLWSFFIALVIVLAFTVFNRRTKLGLAMRAAQDNQIAARCLGVSARLNSQIAWVMCTLLATMGGILIAMTTGVSIGLSSLVLVALSIVLLGGLDSLVGCFVGGLVLAIGSNLVAYFADPLLPGISSILGTILILFILIFRPSGLFGSKPVERV
jgi:branched-chain amino acid transport system permease protein